MCIPKNCKWIVCIEYCVTLYCFICGLYLWVIIMNKLEQFKNLLLILKELKVLVIKGFINIDIELIDKNIRILESRC